NHEDRMALFDSPPHERPLCAKVEHIEFIDPWRDDEKRPAKHRLRYRLILDDFCELVPRHHLAGRDGNVLAKLELRGIRLAQPQPALTVSNILRQHLHAANQVLAIGCERLAKYLRIGE